MTTPQTAPRARLPLSLVSELGRGFFKGRAGQLARRLDALEAVAQARLPSLQPDGAQDVWDRNAGTLARALATPAQAPLRL